MSTGPIKLILAMACILLGACAHVDPQREVLREFRIEGNERLSSGDISERLALTETSPWPWSEPGYYDQGTMVGDRRRLLRFYQAEGFYQARVVSRVRRDDGQAWVTFTVTEGPETKVTSLTVDSQEPLPEEVRDALFSRPLPLREGERMREAAYDQTRELLQARLRDQGFADAVVRGAVEVEVDRGEARVHYELAPGKRVRYGRIAVTGSVEVPRSTIVEVVRRKLPEGRIYRASALQEAEAELVDLGVFAGVRITRGPVAEGSDEVALLVAVREAPFRTVRAGAGAGLDTNRLEARAIGEFHHRNFLGGLRSLRWQNRLGYATLFEDFGTWTESGVVGSSALDFVQPRLFGPLDLNLRAEYEHGLEPAYAFDALRGRVGVPIRLSRWVTFTPSFNIELFSLDPFVETLVEDEQNCQLERGRCVLTYLEERVAWDRRDDPLNTRRGHYTALALQQARPWIGSQSSYDRVLAEARYFQPIGATVLALKLEGGLLLPHDDELSPITQRFYAGGTTSIRAFANGRLAPQALREGVTPEGPITEDETESVGGDALLEASAELRVPVAGDLGAAFFVDAGNVSRFAAPGEQGFSDLLKPNVGLGLGLRYRTPFGPVRLDAGFLVLRNDPCLFGAATCGEVEVEVSSWALHFGIGEAF